MITLTDREIECLQWAAKGKSSREIAVILGLTTRGVDFHFDSAREKLNAVNRIQAVAIAISNELIDGIASPCTS